MALKDKILDRAQKFIQKGYLDKAIAEYKAAFELDPKDSSIRLRMGDLYIKTGKKDEAIKEYAEAAKANSQRGFYLKAIAVWKQVLKLDHANLDVHNKLADLYTKQRLIADAISEYSFIVTVFERNGKTQETLELLKKMVDIDPENIGVRLKLADLHHRLSYKNDALAEYAGIFDRLISQGKHEKAEKIYLGLANSYPGEAKVLEKLAGLYKAGGNGAEFYKYGSRLFDIYKNSGDTENAKATCRSILEVRPNDAASLAYLSKLGIREGPISAAPSFEEPAREPISREDILKGAKDLSRTSETVREVTPEVIKEEPEEEIEISLEGFEDVQEEGAKEEVTIEAAEAPNAAEAAPPALNEDIVLDEIKPGYVGAEVKAGESPEPAEPRAEEEKEVEFELGTGAVVSEAEKEAVTEPVSELPPEHPLPVQTEAALNESEEKPDEEVKSAVTDGTGDVHPEEDVLKEISLPSSEKEEGMSFEESEAGTGEVASMETAPSLKEPEAVPEEPEFIAQIEEIETEPAAAEPQSGIPQDAQVAEEAIEPQAIEEISGPDTVIPEAQTPAAAHDVKAEEAQYIETMEEAEPGESVEPAFEYEEVQEDLSKAISELMEKIEPEGAEPDAYNQKAGIIEEAPGEIAEEGEAKEEYVDLSAELGMEETVKDLAESWVKDEPRDTFDEFKNGIGKQLNKEDSETHYNLGIAYMEMELYSEAVKEFKIALKDAHLEFDCYIRLGLCHMALSNPDDAIMSYLRGLRVRGRSDEERMGMMYELALAYESTGKKELAQQLFKSIHDIAPDYREVSKKIKGIAEERPFMPLDDGLIEVELL